MITKKYCYDYPRPAVSADCVVIDLEKKEILLIQRKNEPFRSMWALPGGFVEEDETVKTGALRELKEETGLNSITLELIDVFSDPDRDPRGRIITAAYLARVRKAEMKPVAGDDAKSVQWFALDSLPALAFDHSSIIEQAMNMA
jgi:8-oxo-dGTP diphosphatase